jgi:hypothetical protein
VALWGQMAQAMGGQRALRGVELGLQELRVPPWVGIQLEVHGSIGCLCNAFSHALCPAGIIPLADQHTLHSSPAPPTESSPAPGRYTCRVWCVGCSESRAGGPAGAEAPGGQGPPG